MKKNRLLVTTCLLASSLSLHGDEPVDSNKTNPSEEAKTVDQQAVNATNQQEAAAAQEAGIKTPEQIEQELNQAQKDLEIAEKMFNPWYTGPLITGSANNVPKGKTNIQFYSFFTDKYANFNDNRRSVSVPNVFTWNPLLLVQRGLTTWLDATLNMQAFVRSSQDKSAETFGDLSLTFGFQLAKQTPNIPAIRLTIGETFPTGKYTRLNSNKLGLDSSGAGIFATTFGLNLNKIFFSNKLHPVSLRFSGTYTVPNNHAHVHGFNSYGGGVGTRGEVSVGQTLNLDVGVEVSLTQKWVFATDIAYTLSFASHFSGHPGFSAPGVPAVNGAPYSDNLSLAPAIEYNFNENGGFIGGIWFPVTGKNSANFVSVILSYTYLF